MPDLSSHNADDPRMASHILHKLDKIFTFFYIQTYQNKIGVTKINQLS